MKGFWEGRMHPEDLSRIRETLKALPRGREVLTLEYRILARSGVWHWLRDRVPRAPSGTGAEVPGCLFDITAEREARERLELLLRISCILDCASGLADASPSLLGEIARAGNWDWAGLWTATDQPGHLALESAWARPGSDLSAFEHKSRGLTFQADGSRLGIFEPEERIQWLERLPLPATHPRGAEAEACGFASACCFPVRVGGAVFGFIEFFGTEARAEQPGFIDTLRYLEGQIGHFATRRRIEAERTRLMEILEATPDFVGMANEKGEILYGNAAMRALRGPDSPEAHRSIQEAHPDWAAKLITSQAFPTAIERGSWQGESALLDLQGQEFPVSQVIVAHRDEAGHVRFFSTIARDISEQKRVEENLWSILKSLHDLQFAVEESMEFSVTDSEGRILDMNRRFCELSGYSREELLGKDHRILNSGHHPRELFQEMWQTIKGGKVWRGEIRNRTKQGSYYWVDATIIPWLGPDGEPERFMALRKVITERKVAEEQALRREEQMKVLLRVSRDLNRDLDVALVMRRIVLSGLELSTARAGGVGLTENGKVRFTEFHRDGTWVPTSAEFAPGDGVPGHVLETGLPWRSQGISIGLSDQGVGLKQPDLGHVLCVPILDREGRSLGCIELRKAATEAAFTEEDETLLMGLGDAASVALVNAREIAQRERHQQAMLHTQKLESLGVQAGGIAHDFNNLLSAIAGNISLAQLHENDGQAAHYLENVNATILRAADLTQQLLAYAGKVRSGPQNIDLNALVKGMVKLLAVSTSKKARIHMDLADSCPNILADRGEIQQVVMNLVINASDALNGAEGDIFVTTRMECLGEPSTRIDVDGRPVRPGAYVCLEVRDTGCGMAEDVRKRIFDPFFTTKSSGRGLGLSAILGIIRHHGATLELETAPGKGTTFTIRFAPVAGSEAPVAEPEPGRCWMGQGRILLAEDEEDVRCATAHQLIAFGFEVVEARNGEEALARFEEGPPFRLVLTDLTMPVMDGLEVARRVRNLAPETKIVVYSGLTPDAGPEAMKHIDAMLSKPFKWQELNGLLKRLLDTGV